MRYGAAEQLEIIRLVEQSALPLGRTLTQLGIPRSTFYLWDERYWGTALEPWKMASRRRADIRRRCNTTSTGKLCRRWPG